MDDQEKRQIIERAFGSFMEESDPEWPDGSPVLGGGHESLDIERLAKQAVAIEAEVGHTYDREGSYGTQFPLTIVKKGVWVLETFQGHQGTEGPYLFIGLPLPPKEDEG